MTIVWVVYDIVENSIRNKVARICLDIGLYRIQKSVFIGNLDTKERDYLTVMCEKIIDPNVDSIYIFPMDSESFKKVKIIGQEFDKELVSDELLTKFV